MCTENDIYNFYGSGGDTTAFTACYLNNEVRSAYHTDGRNAEFSALFPMGKYEGGGLVLPQFGVCFNIQPGGLLLFNGSDVHGVLPYTGTRCSGVFFAPDSEDDVLDVNPAEENQLVFRKGALPEMGWMVFTPEQHAYFVAQMKWNRTPKEKRGPYPVNPLLKKADL